MKYALLLALFFIFSALHAAERDAKKMTSWQDAFTNHFCGDAEFLKCTDLKPSECSNAFQKSVEKCSKELSILNAFVDKEKSPFETNPEMEKAKRDFGKCSVEQLYSHVDKDTYNSCSAQLSERHMKQLEQKLNKASKNDAK